MAAKHKIPMFVGRRCHFSHDRAKPISETHQEYGDEN